MTNRAEGHSCRDHGRCLDEIKLAFLPADSAEEPNPPTFLAKSVFAEADIADAILDHQQLIGSSVVANRFHNGLATGDHRRVRAPKAPSGESCRAQLVNRVVQ